MILRGLKRTVDSLDLLLVVMALVSMRRERLEFHDDALEESWDALSTDRQLALVENPDFHLVYQVRAAGDASLILTSTLAGLIGFLAGEQILAADFTGAFYLGILAACAAAIRGLRRRHRFHQAGDELARLMA